MQTSKTFKQQQSSCSMLVRGSFQSFPEPCPFSSISTAGKTLFLALCTPTVDRLGGVESHLCPSFHSVHALDMSFTRLSDRYKRATSIRGMNNIKSWYFILFFDSILCLFLSVFCILWGTRRKKWLAAHGTA